MAKNKFGMKFEGFEELMENLDALGGDLKEVTEECLYIPNEVIAPKLHAGIKRHRRTGNTEASIVDNTHITWEGQTASVGAGFDLKNGGMPSIFLMYGTPRMKKDAKLYADIYGSATKKKIAEEQEKILRQAIEKRMGG